MMIDTSFLNKEAQIIDCQKTFSSYNFNNKVCSSLIFFKNLS